LLQTEDLIRWFVKEEKWPEDEAIELACDYEYGIRESINQV
jgi:hypothetical protein